MSREVNIEAKLWHVGEDKVFRIPIVDVDGAPYPLTGKSLEWTMRSSLSSATAVLTKTNVNSAGITLANYDATDDAVDIHLYDGDTYTSPDAGPPPVPESILIAAGTYYHTLRTTDPGDEHVLAEGTVILSLAAGR